MMLGLSKPEDFKGDGYGYVTNQLSHTLLGGFLVTTYCYLGLAILGEYPNQTVAFVVITLAYLIWWEIVHQGWRGLDTIEDTLYVTLGAFPFLIIEMDWVVGKLFWWFVTVFVVTLTRGCCIDRRRHT